MLGISPRQDNEGGQQSCQSPVFVRNLSHNQETSSHIFQTIWSMTKLSKARQEEAASAGIIPLLKKVIKGTSRLDQFALPIFCELANAGKVSRRLLWKNDGLQCMSSLPPNNHVLMKVYLKLLGDPYWRGQALDAILVWYAPYSKEEEELITGCKMRLLEWRMLSLTAMPQRLL
jgi:hypothetical protein